MLGIDDKLCQKLNITLPQNEKQSDRISYGGTYEYVGTFDLGPLFVFYEQNPYDKTFGQSRLKHNGEDFTLVVSGIEAA